jgi:hypothetical protein
MKLDLAIPIEPNHRTKASEAMPEKPQVQAKYISMKDVEPIYGIGRTKIYSLVKEGKIRMIKLGDRHNKQIKVLVDVASLEAYLSGLPSHVIPSLDEK